MHFRAGGSKGLFLLEKKGVTVFPYVVMKLASRSQERKVKDIFPCHVLLLSPCWTHRSNPLNGSWYFLEKRSTWRSNTEVSIQRSYPPVPSLDISTTRLASPIILYWMGRSGLAIFFVLNILRDAYKSVKNQLSLFCTSPHKLRLLLRTLKTSWKSVLTVGWGGGWVALTLFESWIQRQ